ncbi:hypothetical protein GRI58_02520 [Porphyrobacter algicida]|uniref:Uncharacterized protein n=1 Tax=Qipengyuania algicida TaxID=1836209 RepID=A0A845AGL3_9SPHN|nr:hypothetical protein [Qipengyuania algicida]MXP27696.1 hypothetical protein [Qipengyuania algicida]
MKRLFQLAVATVLGGIAASTTAMGADPDSATKVSAVIARSKLTKKTYAIYFWNKINHPNQTSIEEWSAEFNSGSRHRVETPRDRLIADCAAMTGTYFSLLSGEVIRGPQVAAAACGIDTNRKFLDVSWLGRVNSRFGEADRVIVTDADNIRTYDISDEGVILRTIYQTNDVRHLTVLDVETVALTKSLPSGRMFDEASLKESFVPEEFKRAPASAPST